jgi:hypothetical protein
VKRSITARRAVATAAAAVVAVAMVALAFVACAPIDGEPVPNQSAVASATPTPTPTPTPDPQFVAGGTADQNLPFFTFVLQSILDRTSSPPSLELVETLAASGFDRAAISVTPDTTRIGDPADSILVAVLIGDQCLLGQVAQETLVTELADVLGSGQCLVGRTLSLD